MKIADKWKLNPYTNEDGSRGYEDYVEKDFSSELSMNGFQEYILASPHILNRITGFTDHDFGKNVFFLETKSHEFESNDDYLIRCTGDYSNNAIVISLNGKELYSKYKKTCRSWAQARKYIIELINILEDMKKEEGDNLMNKNVKVAKELIKLAKSLVANNIDEQTQRRLDEAEKAGKKYILHHKEGNLWRIQYCKNFDCAEKGEFGGLIESEKNLSHNGQCFIFDDAKVYGNARVIKDAFVGDNAQIYGNAIIEGGDVGGKVEICDNAKVSQGSINGNVKVYDKAYIKYCRSVSGSVMICDNAFIDTNGQIFGNAYVGGNAKVYGNASVSGKTQIYDEAQVYDDAYIRHSSKIYENAKVYGNAEIKGTSKIHGYAKVDYDVVNQEITK